MTKKDKLLVLDIHKTLCNFSGKSLNSTDPIISRPHLIEFLTDVSKYYELAVWSATTYDVITTELLSLGIRNNHAFEINFVFDKYSMETVQNGIYGKWHWTKPLDEIWKNSRYYNATNTLIIDDRPLNFICNPHNGLEIVPYEQYIYGTDHELIEIRDYLIKLAQNCSDFTTVVHSDYKNYNPTV